VRYAARQIVIKCVTLSDPPANLDFSDTSYGWGLIFEAFDADEDLADIAKAMRDAISQPNQPEWVEMGSELGVNALTASMLGLGPEIDGATIEEDPAELEEVQVGVGGPTYDEDAVEQQHPSED
jgi:hypothetical protein